jgi:hypothetical protein
MREPGWVMCEFEWGLAGEDDEDSEGQVMAVRLVGAVCGRDVNLDIEYEMKLVYLEWMEIMQVFVRKKMGPA